MLCFQSVLIVYNRWPLKRSNLLERRQLVSNVWPEETTFQTTFFSTKFCNQISIWCKGVVQLQRFLNFISAAINNRIKTMEQQVHFDV